jgi:hypothetical protein
LCVEVDEEPQPIDNVVSMSAFEEGFTLSNQVEVDVPSHGLSLHWFAPIEEQTTVPNENIVIDYQLNPNTLAQDRSPGVFVSSVPTQALNWHHASFTGEVIFASVGQGAGDIRCGALELWVAWQDDSESHAQPTFAVILLARSKRASETSPRVEKTTCSWYLVAMLCVSGGARG